jgi:hypothetical protein
MEEEEAAAAAMAVSLAPLDWSQPNSQEEDAPEAPPTAEGMDTQETQLTGESLLKPLNGINSRTTAPTNSITSDEDEVFVPPAIISQSITDFLLDLAVPSQATEAGPQEATAGPAPSSQPGPTVAMETNSTLPESASKAISTATKGLTLTSVLKEANKANAAVLGAIPKTIHKPRQPLSAASASLHTMSQGNASHGVSDDLRQGEGTAPGGNPSSSMSSRGGGTAPAFSTAARGRQGDERSRVRVVASC